MGFVVPHTDVLAVAEGDGARVMIAAEQSLSLDLEPT